MSFLKSIQESCGGKWPLKDILYNLEEDQILEEIEKYALLQKNKNNIKTDFENAVNSYMEAFCNKQDLTLDFWVGDRIGEIAAFVPFWFFTFDDIRRDIDQKIEAGVIKEWHESTMNKDINYNSYLMGAR